MDYSLHKIIDIDVPFGSHVINIYKALMLLERFSRGEVATEELLCTSDINI